MKRAVLTDRLDLRRPTADDLDELFAIASDPRVWQHFPSGRHACPAQTRSLLERWTASWDAAGLGAWAVRLRGDERVIGYGGCSLVGDVVWNLGYRIAAEQHGRGYATELAREAVRQAQIVRPQTPVVAYLLEHNTASARVAVKLGFELAWRGPDAGNPDETAIRLVYADRPLSREQLGAVLH